MSTKRKRPDSDEDDGDDSTEFASLEEFKNVPSIAEVAKQNRKTMFINNTAGLAQKREELELSPDWPWIETLAVTPNARVVVEDVEDDLEREAAFYAAALAATKQALVQLDQSGVPYKRPLDYYAEPVKPDSHMAKVKQVLLNEQKRTADVEARKKVREQKKFAKMAHSEKVKERAKQKREALDEIDRIKNNPKYSHNEPSSAAFKRSIKKGSSKGGDRDGGSGSGGSGSEGGDRPAKRFKGNDHGKGSYKGSYKGKDHSSGSSGSGSGSHKGGSFKGNKGSFKGGKGSFKGGRGGKGGSFKGGKGSFKESRK